MTSKKTPEVNPEAPGHNCRVCGTCQHWERFPEEVQTAGEDALGECLLHPPVVFDLGEDGGMLQVCPRVGFRDRCGQHKPQVH